MDSSMERMGLLNVQSLARGNSGATGMEFNAQNICYTKTGVVCVLVESERERERVVLALECAIFCSLVYLFRMMLRSIRARSDC